MVSGHLMIGVANSADRLRANRKAEIVSYFRYRDFESAKKLIRKDQFEIGTGLGLCAVLISFAIFGGFPINLICGILGVFTSIAFAPAYISDLVFDYKVMQRIKKYH